MDATTTTTRDAAAAAAHDEAHARAGYTIVRTLGRTAEAGRTTLLARTVGGEEVVLKHFAFGAPSAGWDGYSSVELEALLGIRHPQVPRYLASYRTGEDGFCLVQSYLQAPPIEATAPWGLPETLALAAQMLEILVHLEDKVVPPVVHGDLSPGNIRRDAAGGFHLVDFVLTREKLGPLGLRSRVAGTPGFVAPERVRGARGDVRSDLYGLGTTLVSLLAGVAPAEVGERLVEADGTVRLAALPAALRERPALMRWLHGLTAADANARYNHARIALKALRALPAAETTALEPAPGAEARPAAGAATQAPRAAHPAPGTGARPGPAPGTEARPGPGAEARPGPAPGTGARPSPGPGAEARLRAEAPVIDRTRPGGDFVRAMLLLFGAVIVLILLAMWVG